MIDMEPLEAIRLSLTVGVALISCIPIKILLLILNQEPQNL